eukprot:Rmarinus@m.3019
MNDLSLNDFLSNINSENDELITEGLRRFRQCADGYADLSKDSDPKWCPVVHQYLTSSPKAAEIFRIWDAQGVKTNRLVDAVLGVLASILSSPIKPKLRSTVSNIVHLLTQQYIKKLSAYLTSENPRVSKWTLKLFSSIVGTGAGSAKELLHALSPSMTSLSKLGWRRKKSGETAAKPEDSSKREDLRHLFVQFVLSLLRTGDGPLIATVLTTSDLNNPTIAMLPSDPPSLAVEILTAFRDHVLRFGMSIEQVCTSSRGNDQAPTEGDCRVVAARKSHASGGSGLPRGLRVRFFTSNVVLEALVGCVLGSADVYSQTVAQTAQEFLLEMLGTKPWAVLPATENSSSPLLFSHSAVLRMLLKLQPATCPLQHKLVSEVVFKHPPLRAPYVAAMPGTLVPRLSVPWLAMMSLLEKLLATPYHVLPDGRLPPAAAVVDALLPAKLSKTSLTSGLLHSRSLVKYTVLRVLAALFVQLDAVCAASDPDGGSRHPTAADDGTQAVETRRRAWGRFRGELEETIRPRLPDLNVLVGLPWFGSLMPKSDDTPVLQGKAKARAQAVKTAMTDGCNGDGEENEPVNAECPNDAILMQTVLLRVIRGYQRHVPSTVAEARFDFSRLISDKLVSTSPLVVYQLVSLLHQAHRSAAFKWHGGSSHSRLSRLGDLLNLYLVLKNATGRDDPCGDDDQPAPPVLQELQDLILDILIDTPLFGELSSASKNCSGEGRVCVQGSREEAAIWLHALSPETVPHFDLIVCQAAQKPFRLYDVALGALLHAKEAYAASVDCSGFSLVSRMLVAVMQRRAKLASAMIDADSPATSSTSPLTTMSESERHLRSLVSLLTTVKSKKSHTKGMAAVPREILETAEWGEKVAAFEASPLASEGNPTEVRLAIGHSQAQGGVGQDRAKGMDELLQIDYLLWDVLGRLLWSHEGTIVGKLSMAYLATDTWRDGTVIDHLSLVPAADSSTTTARHPAPSTPSTKLAVAEGTVPAVCARLEGQLAAAAILAGSHPVLSHKPAHKAHVAGGGSRIGDGDVRVGSGKRHRGLTDGEPAVDKRLRVNGPGNAQSVGKEGQSGPTGVSDSTRAELATFLSQCAAGSFPDGEPKGDMFTWKHAEPLVHLPSSSDATALPQRTCAAFEALQRRTTSLSRLATLVENGSLLDSAVLRRSADMFPLTLEDLKCYAGLAPDSSSPETAPSSNTPQRSSSDTSKTCQQEGMMIDNDDDDRSVCAGAVDDGGASDGAGVGTGARGDAGGVRGIRDVRNGSGAMVPQGVSSELLSLYDVRAVLQLLKLLVDSGHVDCRRWVESHVLGVAVAAMSCEVDPIRRVGYYVVSKFLSLIEGDSEVAKAFRDRTQVAMALTALRESIVKELEVIPFLQTTFVRFALPVLTQPDHPLYAHVNNFLLARPFLDLRVAPMGLTLTSLGAAGGGGGGGSAS